MNAASSGIPGVMLDVFGPRLAPATQRKVISVLVNILYIQYLLYTVQYE